MSKFYVEIYRSSFTGGTLYSPVTRMSGLKQALEQTADNELLKTIQVIQFKWSKEINGYHWSEWKGLELHPVPFTYKRPSLYSLTGNKPPKPIRFEVARKIKVPEGMGKQLAIL